MMRKERWWADVQSCTTTILWITSVSGWLWWGWPLAVGEKELSQHYIPKCIMCLGTTLYNVQDPYCLYRDKGWSFHSSSVTPELSAGLPWASGIIDRDGWKDDSSYMTQKKLLQQLTMGLWLSLYLVKGSLYSQRASHPTCNLTDPQYLPPSFLTTEERQELVLDSSSPYP